MSTDIRTKALMPLALLLDLDDTIVDDIGPVDTCWEEACQQCDLGEGHLRVLAAITKVRDWFWSDPERHRRGRLDLNAARRSIVAAALQGLGSPDAALGNRIADRYGELRELQLQLLPGAVETVKWFRDYGCRTALLTNGAAVAQRRKITRFSLAPLFDFVFIEGELGFGKPDYRIYERALAALGVSPADTWMVGDNLEWDIAPAQALGIHAVWVDVRGQGLPPSATCRPNRIVRRLSELRDPI